MMSMTPAQSWMVVLAALLVGVLILLAMLALDNLLDPQRALLASESDDRLEGVDAELVPAGRHLQLVTETPQVPNQRLYDWQTQGL